MAWTTPKLFEEGEQLTARDLNLYLRDNLLENEVMKATTPGARLSTDLDGNLVERQVVSDSVSTAETAVSNAYYPISPTQNVWFTGPVDIGTIGPSVTVETGTRAIIFYSARIKTTDPFLSSAAPGIDIPTSPNHRMKQNLYDANLAQSSGDWFCPRSVPMSVAMMAVAEDLTPGINTFVMRYKLPSQWLDYSVDEFEGDYRDTQATYSNRHILVIPL